MELPERKIYTVAELTERIRELLEKHYRSVWVQGEVSNLRHAPSGHLYFTLKDDASQIRCVMFKIQSRFLKFRLEDGLKIVAWGRLTVYSLRGEYQLILDTMEPLGLGSLMLAFEQLKARLEGEGLFDRSRKKAVPSFPSSVGLVTSPRGAAVLDMIRIMRRRFPGINILVSPTSVQGDRAPGEIVQAIERLCASEEVDVIVVGRGGGSVEDLWAFNDERVVRAVAGCPLPTVSAVGHETDVTLTDFAADLRASTPSAAAELLVPDKRDLQEGVLHLAARLKNAMRGTLSTTRESVNQALRRLHDPRRQIEERRLSADDLTMRLSRAANRTLTAFRAELEAVAQRLRPDHLRRITGTAAEECSSLRERLVRAMQQDLKDGRNLAEALSTRLDALSPLAVLSRGYSITLRADSGAVVTDSRSMQAGDDVRVRLHRGTLSCRVTGTEEPEELA